MTEIRVPCLDAVRAAALTEVLRVDHGLDEVTTDGLAVVVPWGGGDPTFPMGVCEVAVTVAQSVNSDSVLDFSETPLVIQTGTSPVTLDFDVIAVGA